MNKYIKILIEQLSTLFNDDIFNDDNETEQIGKQMFYKYFPKDKKELRTLLEQLLKERGRNADLNDIDTSLITDMSELFHGLNISNIKIDGWDV
jgi:hypothetical protein